eukprot:148868-Amphidinium_carterae.1
MRLEWHRIPTIDLELEASKQLRRMSRVHRPNPRRKRRHPRRVAPTLRERSWVDIPGCITNARDAAQKSIS